jgi:hypothetical protein
VWCALDVNYWIIEVSRYFNYRILEPSLLFMPNSRILVAYINSFSIDLHQWPGFIFILYPMLMHVYFLGVPLHFIIFISGTDFQSF